MALDGIFLHFLKQEIEREALGAGWKRSASLPGRSWCSRCAAGRRRLPYRGLEAAAQRALQ